MRQEQEQYVIDAQLAQAILTYLIKLPYREVHELIYALQQIKPSSGREGNVEVKDAK